MILIVSCKEFHNEMLNLIKDKITELNYELNKTGYNLILGIDKCEWDSDYTMYVNGVIKDCEKVGLSYFYGDINKKLISDYFHYIGNRQVKYSCNSLNIDIFDKGHKYPAIVKGISEYIAYNKLPLKGKRCVVIGRSKNIGNPLYEWLISQNATVTICHSFTPIEDIKGYCNNADYVFAATNTPNLINCRCLKPNSIIFDVGAFDETDKKFKGNIEVYDNTVAEYMQIYSDEDWLYDNHIYITPVKNGVGLLTRIGVLLNVLAFTKNTREYIIFL